MPPRIDLTNMQFGDLKVMRLADDLHGFKSLPRECQCSCKKIVYVPGGSLRAGTYKSCGCKRVAKRDKGVQRHIAADSLDGTRKSALIAKLHSGNKSGHKGVIWLESRQKWRAYIGFRGKQIALGHFSNINDAITARFEAEDKYHSPYK